MPGRKRLYGAPAPPTRRPVGCSSACLYGILKYPDCTLPPKRKDIRKDVLSFWAPSPKGGYTLRYFNAQGGKAAPSPRYCLRQNARTPQKRRGPEGPLGKMSRWRIENLEYLDCSALPKQKATAKAVAFCFGFRPPEAFSKEDSGFSQLFACFSKSSGHALSA